MAAGIHIVRKVKPGRPVRWYVYAWRGGPQILAQEGGARPAVTPALTDAAAAARAAPPAVQDTIRGLITRYAGSPEWRKLAASTRADYSAWHVRILDEFGDTPLKVFADARVRADVLDWRDRWADRPRTADMGMTAFSALLGWGKNRGLLAQNVLLGAGRLYDFDRSDVIWEDAHFAAFTPHASVEVLEAVELAAFTGLRRSDLVLLPWSAIGENAIVWKTSKSRGRNMIVVPLLPETRQLLARIRRRAENAMEARRKDKRRPLPTTVLTSSYLRPWTRDGFTSRFQDAKRASGIDVNFHDLRGTFATRCMIAGVTDQEIANLLGWSTKDVARIRAKYVDNHRVVIALAERIAAAKAG